MDQLKQITHISAGDETWTPTSEELKELVLQFMTAERDPLGGIVATRNSVYVTTYTVPLTTAEQHAKDRIAALAMDYAQQTGQSQIAALHALVIACNEYQKAAASA